MERNYLRFNRKRQPISGFISPKGTMYEVRLSRRLWKKRRRQNRTIY